MVEHVRERLVDLALSENYVGTAKSRMSSEESGRKAKASMVCERTVGGGDSTGERSPQTLQSLGRA